MPEYCWEVNLFEPEGLGVNRKPPGRQLWGISSECGSGIETRLPQGPGQRERKERVKNPQLAICRPWGGVESSQTYYFFSKRAVGPV